MIGVKTVGHATLIAYDDVPLLVTDPWLGGRGAYFGSWQLTHPVPKAELDELRRCRYVWISHGHPDHLCLESLASLRHATVLVPDHVGGRIARELAAEGFTVEVLPDRRWVALSPRVRLLCLSDAHQNGVLFLDVNGTLFLDLNDASDRGWGASARKLVSGFRRSFLLKLAQTGNLGVLNLFDEAGERAWAGFVDRAHAGAALGRHADHFGVSDVIPFSSFHACQRRDSAWVNEHLGTPEDYPASFASDTGARLLPAFVEIDCERDDVRELDVARNEIPVLPPEAFGDSWSDPLEREDLAVLRRYFTRRELLRERVGFVDLRVGGRTDRIVLNRERATGITLEAPRRSLVEAARHEVFDDLLLGYFMKITLHGLDLVPDVLPAMTRWADNGGARSREEVEAYLEAYRRREAVPLPEPVLERALASGSPTRLRR